MVLVVMYFKAVHVFLFFISTRFLERRNEKQGGAEDGCVRGIFFFSPFRRLRIFVRLLFVFLMGEGTETTSDTCLHAKRKPRKTKTETSSLAAETASKKK
jgi:hypothetical protein